jgi:hypothetical protein
MVIIDFLFQSYMARPPHGIEGRAPHGFYVSFRKLQSLLMTTFTRQRKGFGAIDVSLEFAEDTSF